MYSGLTTRVKWKGELSNAYPVLQGVREGGILSTHLYKIFVQDLLLELEENTLGYVPPWQYTNCIHWNANLRR
jgi:hypothetical protein